MSHITVSAINVFPVKSAAGMSLPSTKVFDYGLLMDRNYVVIRDNVPEGKDNFLSQRYPGGEKLVDIIPEKNGVLRLNGALIPTNHNMSEPQIQRVQIHGRQTSGVDCGNDAAKILTDHLKMPVRLVFANESSLKPVDANYSDHGMVAFGDGFPFLFVNEASLQALNEGDGQPITMDRFRGNIVLSGLAPFEEDGIEAVRIDGVRYDFVKPCSRCAMPDVDQKTGAGNKGRDYVTKRLQQFRRSKTGPQRNGKEFSQTYFGMNAVADLPHDSYGVIKQSSSVEIIKRRASAHHYVQGCFVGYKPQP